MDECADWNDFVEADKDGYENRCSKQGFEEVLEAENDNTLGVVLLSEFNQN